VNEIFVTVAGTVGSDVQYLNGDRNTRARFRMATAERFFDRSSEQWANRETVWLDVVCWRSLADHVAESVKKGEPVLVRGRLRVSTWQSDSGPRQSIEVIATSIGHDLARGVSTFRRPQRPSEPAAPAAVSAAAPAEPPAEPQRTDVA
jgi:single-strand DNA-binding protein